MTIFLIFSLSFNMTNITYPETRKQNIVDTIFGVAIADPYRWLEKIDDPEVKTWIEQQNKLTRSILDSLPYKNEIVEELKSLFNLTTVTLPIIRDNEYFFFKHSGLQNHSVLFHSTDSVNYSSVDAIIDPNTFSTDGTVGLDWFEISSDGRYIAYGKSPRGSEKSTLYIIDTRTKKLLPDTIPDTRWASIAWLPDNSGFYYTKNVEPNGYRPYVYFHKLGTDYSKDKYIAGKDLPEEHLPSIQISSDGSYLMLYIHRGWGKNDLYIRPVNSDGEFIPVAVGFDASFDADIVDGYIYILTTLNASRGKLLKISTLNPSLENAVELLPEQRGVIQNFRILNGYIVVKIKEDTFTRLLVYDTSGVFKYEVPLPDKGSAYISGYFKDTKLYYQFQSFFYPPTIFQIDLKTKEIKKLWQMKAGIDQSEFKQEFIFYESTGGVKVPMYIIYPKGLKKNGKNPTILTGYGGFGIGLSPFFTRYLLPWLKRGGVYAIAGIRGGNEYGEEWHKAGMRENKQNVFDDFANAAKYLIQNGYTDPEHLGISGGSNGGLLVGAALTQHPELFKAVYCSVPLLDMLRYHLFNVAHIWKTEYGDPEKEEDFRYLYVYSPYHHVKRGVKYPSVFLKTAESDTRVHPMHALKMTAKLQEVASPDRPVLLYVEPKTGHGAGKPLWKTIQSYADQLTFMLWQLKEK